jgi:hypothetical protein
VAGGGCVGLAVGGADDGGDGVAGAGAVTVTADVPFPVPLCAVMAAEPAATAVTSPLGETVATFVFDESHVMVGLDTVPPLDSFTVALSCLLPATASETDEGETATETVGGGAAVTCTSAYAACAADDTRIFARPGFRPVTTPWSDTTAMVVSDDFHWAGATSSFSRDSSWNWTSSVTFAPLRIAAVAGDTTTHLTRAASGEELCSSVGEDMLSTQAVIASIPVAMANSRRGSVRCMRRHSADGPFGGPTSMARIRAW